MKRFLPLTFYQIRITTGFDSNASHGRLSIDKCMSQENQNGCFAGIFV